MKKLAIAFAAALSLLAFTTKAQEPPRLVETMEVQVVNIDVVVTDKNGKRVTGLTENDFEVFDRKKRQTITNFSEIGATIRESADAPPASDAPPSADVPPIVRRRNTVIFFIDTTSIDPSRRGGVFKELRRFAATSLQPGDRAMLAIWTKGLQILQPFTESGEEMQRALQQAGEDAGGTQLISNRRRVQKAIEHELASSLRNPNFYPIGDAYAAALEHTTSYAEEMYAHSRLLTVAVATLLSQYASPEDKKVLVYVGDYLPQNAGAEMYQVLEDLFRAYLPQLKSMLRNEAIGMAQWLEDVVRIANATGVTIYMISGGALNQMGVDASDSRPPLTTRAAAILDTETYSAFANTALQTGGMTFAGGSARDLLQQIADDFRSYYSIGFRPAGSPDGKSRAIVVRTKNPDYVVRYRTSYVLRSTEDEMSDRVAANVYAAEMPGELIVRTQPLRSMMHSRKQVKVPVKVYLEGGNVTLIPSGNTLAGDVTVFVCAGSATTGASEVLKHKRRLYIPMADEARFRASHITFNFDLIIESRPGQTISAGVLDAVSGSYGLARAAVK